MLRRSVRAVAPAALLVLLLTACAEPDPVGIERAADAFFGEFFEFIFTMMVLSTMMTFAYVLLFAGMATAILAAVRAGRGRRDGEPAPETDWLAIGFLIFGGLLLFATSPWLFSVGFSFHDTPGRSIAPLVPLIMLGMALAFAGTSRFRRRRREAAAGAGQPYGQQHQTPQAGWPPVPPPAPPQSAPPAPVAAGPRPAPKRRAAASKAKPRAKAPARAKPKPRAR